MPLAPSTDAATASNDHSLVASWLVLGTLAVGLLFLASVHAPQRVKLPLITPVALGIAAGWGLGRWALARRLSVPKFVLIASFGLIAAGEIGVAVESYRLGKPELQRVVNRLAFQDDGLAHQIDRAFIEQAGDPATRDQFQRQSDLAQRRRQDELDRQQWLLTFAGYLEHRIPKAWGRWPNPWPAIFWGAEVLLASSLGAWLAWHIACKDRKPAAVS
ncbi:MAG: hypothetical protein EXS05_07220 [Planctomycetaceae bacterium]|nr:hypothetical protein [Planctomycetaceae bacterium]